MRESLSDVKDEYEKVLMYEEKKVREAGGLHVIGTERHESRRVDNQLRGRAGRQGDLGSTRFFLSLEDNLLRIFGGDRVANLMNAFRVDEDMPIESGMLTRSLESAQKKVETYYYDIRKQVFEYDEVMNMIIPMIRKTFKDEDAVMLHIKMIKGDRSQYEPDF